MSQKLPPDLVIARWHERLAACHVPDHLRDGLIAYFVEHVRPGSFLMAVLANHLSDAVQRADPKSLAALPDLVGFLVEYAPHDAWGHYHIVRAWLEQRKRA
jgi:hypothetical protein